MLFRHAVKAPERPSRGQRAADWVTRCVGSWRFICWMNLLYVAWALWNSFAPVGRFDRYPYILLNLVMSYQAADTAPAILMSQNRAAERDSLVLRKDYQLALGDHETLASLMARFDGNTTAIHALARQNEEILARLRGLGVGAAAPADT